MERIGQINDFELIPTIKTKTRHPVERSFVSEFRRSIASAELWTPEVARR